jgi:hypothetical protein
MKHQAENLRRLIDKYSIRYGEQNPIVINLKNDLALLESTPKIRVLGKVNTFPSSGQRIAHAQNLENAAH